MTDSDDAARLRSKAEEIAAANKLKKSDVKSDKATLIHELQVHQIELEMQNEDLRQAQEELQVSRDRYANLFEFAPVGYFLLDRYFQIVEANLTGSRILDMERQRLRRKRFTHFLRPEQQDLFYLFFKNAAGEDAKSLEIEMHRYDQTPFVAELKVVQDFIAGIPTYRVALTDITDRKRAEDELKQYRNELELRVQERTKELSRLTGQLAFAEQRERQRLSMVLHDGLQQILVGAKFRLLSVKHGPDLQHRISQVEELIDDAIETSRSLSAELSPPVLLQGDIVAALEWLARWMHDKHGLDVNVIAHQRIKPLKREATLLLFQAARELLFNVVKHSGVKSASMEVDRPNGQILLKLEDGGAGFDPNKLHHAKEQAGGTGLLAIKERLSYLGGHLEIDSAPGQGSRFKLTVPFSTLSGDVEPADEDVQARVSVLISPESESSLSENGKRIRIMLVDDHIVMRQGLAGLLRGEQDFEIVGEASDGVSAIKLAQDIQPDVILMDIALPGIDGVEATRIIHREVQGTRVIGLSMFQEPEREAAIREAGAVSYLSKSGPAEALIDAIRSCVGSG